MERESEDSEVLKFTEGWMAEFEVYTLVFQNIVGCDTQASSFQCVKGS